MESQETKRTELIEKTTEKKEEYDAQDALNVIAGNDVKKYGLVGNDPILAASDRAEALSQLAIIGMLTFGFAVTALFSIDKNLDLGAKTFNAFIFLLSLSIATSGIGMTIGSVMYYALKLMTSGEYTESIHIFLKNTTVFLVQNIGIWLTFLGIILFNVAAGIYLWSLLDGVFVKVTATVFGLIIAIGAR
eukprot:UN06437